MRHGWITAPALGPSAGSAPTRLPVAPLAAVLGELDTDRGDR
jgi:hypothetical protein